jgi:hypothetical protein
VLKIARLALLGVIAQDVVIGVLGVVFLGRRALATAGLFAISAVAAAAWLALVAWLDRG